MKHPLCTLIAFCLGHDYAPHPQPDPEPIDRGLPWLQETEAEEWCKENGYMDLQLISDTPERQWWAFPPNGVMPVPIARHKKYDRAEDGEVHLR